MASFSDRLAALAHMLAPGSRVARVRRLRGGLDAITHAFDLVTPNGDRTPLVLRRLTGSWVAPGHADEEAAVLAALAGTSVPAPRLVWHDDPGDQFAAPAIVMTRLPGRSIVDPRSGPWWIDGIASVLASIHEAGGVAVAAVNNDEEQIPLSLERAEHRETTELARRVIATLRAAAPAVLVGGSPMRLVHRDFHAGNVLFARTAATGAVDWGSAAGGWSERDVGYCRLDLALMAGGDTADRFLAAYERITGAPVANLAFWDLYGASFALPDPAKWLPSWVELGRTDLTAALLRRRLTRWINRCLTQLA
jgi:aminoglycoside phosphotransferase (APT) family kinase protein